MSNETEVDFSALQEEAERAELASRCDQEPAEKARIERMERESTLVGIYCGLPPDLSEAWQMPLDQFTPAQLASRYDASFPFGREREYRIHLMGKTDMGLYGDPVGMHRTILWKLKSKP